MFRSVLRKTAPALYECLRFIRHPEEAAALRAFVLSAPIGKEPLYRDLARKMRRIDTYLAPSHLHSEMMPIARFILERAPPGVIVEAGSYKGGSAAKFSHVCAATGRKLILFDSFEGMPENDEAPYGVVLFPKGDYAGSLDEVKANIEKYGRIDVCEFHKGWFENTLPSFKAEIAVAYVDVDLASSTATCLKYLFPLLAKGGAIFSQDGHLPNVLELLDDDQFWTIQVGVPKPRMSGLGTSKIVTIFKD